MIKVSLFLVFIRLLMATTVKAEDVKGSPVATNTVHPRTVLNLDSNAMRTQIVISRRVTGVKVVVLVSALITVTYTVISQRLLV